MTTLKQIKELIKKSENPLIFFDDDPDGLVSYLLIKKHFGKGIGVVVKGKPMLDSNFLISVRRYNPDLIIVLDKPIIEQDFVDNVHVPIVWIDHHPIVKVKGVKYYNPRLKNKKDNRSVSYWCYKLTNDDLWMATVGIVADYQIPSFINRFIKKYPELLDKIKEQKEILFNTNLGKIIRIFSFSLKGKTEDVKRNMEILIRIKDPNELLIANNEATKILLRRIEKIEKEYKILLSQATKENKSKQIVIFIYPSGKLSFSAELSNELMYKYPDKIIIVGREKDDEVRMSLRSPEKKGIKLPEIVKKALIGLEGYGGGHDYAVGANIKKKDLEQFINVIKNEVL
ncbi:MAG: DHH family phosphoesterase [Nanoarchaeota archaeon]|nr:DHH family phosphoesterase [Nanoarchaeota archaeon]